MNFKNKLTFTAIGLFLTMLSYGQTNETITEYLGVSRSISFDKVSYNLAWTSHPTGNYHKQEYLDKGDTIEKYKINTN